MVKKKKSQANPALADPKGDADIFGEPLADAEDYEIQTEILPDPMVLPEPLKPLPLNQVPGKLRKFLTPKDAK